jgi:hypothetical protein
MNYSEYKLISSLSPTFGRERGRRVKRTLKILINRHLIITITTNQMIRILLLIILSMQQMDLLGQNSNHQNFDLTINCISQNCLDTLLYRSVSHRPKCCDQHRRVRHPPVEKWQLLHYQLLIFNPQLALVCSPAKSAANECHSASQNLRSFNVFIIALIY